MTDGRINMLLWAAALVLSGILLLLFNFNLFVAYEPWVQYFLGALLGLGGLGFFAAFLTARRNWWRLIPAWTLLALAGMLYLSTLAGLNQRLTAALLFMGLALAFSHIYLIRRSEHWWAIIPGGFMLVLGVVIGLSSRIERAETLGALLFIGMGLVFFLLYLLGERRRHWWALIPGSVLIFFGLFIFVLDRGGENSLLRWWPLLLVLLGLLLGWRAYTAAPPTEKLSVNTAPAAGRGRQSAANVGPASPPRTGSERSGRLGDYGGPAPGASVETLPDPERGNEGG